MTVIEYVTEEVRRQGHNVHALDGIERVGWMLGAWGYALRTTGAEGHFPTFEDAIHIGYLVEPYKNKGSDTRTVAVRVGSRRCPAPELVRGLLRELFDKLESFTPVEFYKEFELIHPFVDGNGRTGKILLNWLNGTLFVPVFPPNDLFGPWIENP